MARPLSNDLSQGCAAIIALHCRRGTAVVVSMYVPLSTDAGNAAQVREDVVASKGSWAAAAQGCHLQVSQLLLSAAVFPQRSRQLVALGVELLLEPSHRHAVSPDPLGILRSYGPAWKVPRARTSRWIHAMCAGVSHNVHGVNVNGSFFCSLKAAQRDACAPEAEALQLLLPLGLMLCNSLTISLRPQCTLEKHLRQGLSW